MKGFIVGFIFLITGLTAGGQENTVILQTLGSWPETGNITDLELIQDLYGGIYILYIADGEFRVLKTGEDGQFKPYVPHGFEENFLSVRRLAMISDGPEQYSAFIGTRDGIEKIYLFGLNYLGELVYYPLEETESSVPISAYSLISSHEGELLVFTLTDGGLSCISGGGRDDKITTIREISLQSEGVEDFWVFHNREQKTNYGWYRVFREDHWELTFFLIGDKGLTVREKTESYGGMPCIDHRMALDGTSLFTVLDDRNVSLYQISEGGFVRNFGFDAPIKVRRYIPGLLKKDAAGLLIGDDGTDEIVYGVSFEQSGVPVLKQLFSLPISSIIDIFFTGDDTISLIYSNDRAWRSALINLQNGLEHEGPIEALNESPRMLYTDSFFQPQFCVLRGNEEYGKLAFFRFEGRDWGLLRENPVPPAISISLFQGEKNELLNPFYMENEIITMVSPGGLVIIDDENGEDQFVESDTHTWSRRINGVIFLATCSESEITLYRMEE
jgi:hypothetical protein